MAASSSITFLSFVFFLVLFTCTNGQYYRFSPSYYFRPQALIPFPYVHHQHPDISRSSHISHFQFNPYAAASQITPVAIIPVPVPAVPLPIPTQMIPMNNDQTQEASSTSSSSSSSSPSSTSSSSLPSQGSQSSAEVTGASSETKKEISNRSSGSSSSPFSIFNLGSLQLPNDLSEKFSPFKIRIASHWDNEKNN